MEFWSQWWVWGVAAVALAVGEVILPSYILLGFGIGAAVVALLLLIGLPLAASWQVMVLVFAVISLLSWIGPAPLAGCLARAGEKIRPRHQ